MAFAIFAAFSKKTTASLHSSNSEFGGGVCSRCRIEKEKEEDEVNILLFNINQKAPVDQKPPVDVPDWKCPKKCKENRRSQPSKFIATDKRLQIYVEFSENV
jgi:hypothetical protein